MYICICIFECVSFSFNQRHHSGLHHSFYPSNIRKRRVIFDLLFLLSLTWSTLYDIQMLERHLPQNNVSFTNRFELKCELLWLLFEKIFIQQKKCATAKCDFHWILSDFWVKPFGQPARGTTGGLRFGYSLDCSFLEIASEVLRIGDFGRIHFPLHDFEKGIGIKKRFDFPDFQRFRVDSDATHAVQVDDLSLSLVALKLSGELSQWRQVKVTLSSSHWKPLVKASRKRWCDASKSLRRQSENESQNKVDNFYALALHFKGKIFSTKLSCDNFATICFRNRQRRRADWRCKIGVSQSVEHFNWFIEIFLFPFYIRESCDCCSR